MTSFGAVDNRLGVSAAAIVAAVGGELSAQRNQREDVSYSVEKADGALTRRPTYQWQAATADEPHTSSVLTGDAQSVGLHRVVLGRRTDN